MQTGGLGAGSGSPSPVGASGARGAGRAQGRGRGSGSGRLGERSLPPPSSGTVRRAGGRTRGRRHRGTGRPDAGMQFSRAGETLPRSGEQFGVGFRTVPSPPPAPRPGPPSRRSLGACRTALRSLKSGEQLVPRAEGQWKKMKARNASRAFPTQQTADRSRVSNRLTQRWSYGSARSSPRAAF